MNRVEFLAALHQHLKPRGYMEIGIGAGETLRLASCPTLGIDPHITLTYPRPDHVTLVDSTSDEFFAEGAARLIPQPLDLAFVNGIHLREFALRDLRNLERYANPRTVVVMDGPLPRSQVDGARRPSSGDWVGDVWQVHPILAMHRGDLRLTLVDTQPAGLLLIQGLDPSRAGWSQVPLPAVVQSGEVPDEVLARAYALAPELALSRIEEA